MRIPEESGSSESPRITIPFDPVRFMSFPAWASNPERFEYVVVDEYFPDCIVKNLDKWQHMIVPNAAFHVTDLYRE